MTEFALILPILCVLLFGIIQFGILWNNYVTLTDAVRTGARKAAVNRRGDWAGEGCRQVVLSAQGLDTASLSCAVSSSGDLSRAGGDVTVTASYPYEIDLFGFVLASGRLESTTTERME